MRSTLFKLILLTVVVGSGGLYYLWYQATKLPDDYVTVTDEPRVSNPSESQPSAPIAAEVAVSKSKITMPIQRARIGQRVAVKLTDRDINNLVISRIADTQPNKQIPAGVKGIRTNIRDGKIYTGGLVNLDKLARDGQPGSQVAELSKITNKLPFLKDRDVYIGIVGTPTVEGSQIKFGEDTQIKVGNVNFTISQLSDNLGIAPDKIRSAIDLKLQQQNLQVDRVSLSDRQLAIEGAKK